MECVFPPTCGLMLENIAFLMKIGKIINFRGVSFVELSYPVLCYRL